MLSCGKEGYLTIIIIISEVRKANNAVALIYYIASADTRSPFTYARVFYVHLSSIYVSYG